MKNLSQKKINGPKKFSNKIPVITHIITGLEKGGAERFLFNFLTSDLKGHIKNNVISLMSEGYYGPLIKEKNISLQCLKLNRGQIRLKTLKKLIKILNNQKPDIIQGWMYHGNLAALIGNYLSKKKTKLSWNIRLSLEVFSQMKFKTRLAIKIGALFSKQPDAIIYNSKRSLIQHRKIGFLNNNDYFIPNGFDTEKWKPNKSMRYKIRNSLQIPNNTKVIGYVGRAQAQKDLSSLFRAFDIVKKNNMDVILIAVGKNLQKFASNYNKIIFLGERSDVHNLMNSFDLLCLSSKAEGFPNVIGEAMLSGLPCVATDAGDAKQIIGKTGWIVPVNSPTLLANCLDKVLKIPTVELQKYGKKARQKIIKNYDIKHIKNKYISLYDSIYNKLDK